MSPRRLFCFGLIAAITWSSTPAGAVDLVFDPTQSLHALAEIRQLQDEYNVLQDAYQQAQATTAALQHLNVGINTLAPGLNTNRLPGSSVGAIPGLNFGQDLSQAGQSAYSMNHVYTPRGTDFSALEMQRQQMATANLQGEAASGMQRIAQRVAMLSQLAASIQTQPDVHAMGAINARIGTERLYMANEFNNIAQLNNMLQTQQLVSQQRAAQYGRQQEDENAAAAAVAAGWAPR